MTGPLKIVLVEDDFLIAMYLEELLTGLGHDVCAVAQTEVQAVAAGIRCIPDLMIVDGNLAEGSGVSAMSQILAQFFVPHLYVTGDPLGTAALVPGAVVLTKPFTLRALNDGIEQALRSRGSELPKPA